MPSSLPPVGLARTRGTDRRKLARVVQESAEVVVPAVAHQRPREGPNDEGQGRALDRLDQWIRRRIRMCLWMRWRHVRTRRRELIGLGVPRRQAIRHAKSRKGPWHMAKSIATGAGMTNAWLALQGLISLKSLWASLAPLR